MSSIEWEIKSNRSFDQLIIKLDPYTKIIDYQLQLINSRDIVSIFPLAVIREKARLMISAELGSNNRIDEVDAANKGLPQKGLQRFVQLSELISEVQEYLFTIHQILIHPDLIRFRYAPSDENEGSPILVILPASTAVDHDDMVVDRLIPEWSEFYGISNEISTALKNSYQANGWAGLAECADLAIAKQRSPKKDLKHKFSEKLSVKQAKPIKNSRSKGSRLVFVWLSISTVFTILSKTSLLSISASIKILISIALVLFGIVLLAKSDLLPNSIKRIELPSSLRLNNSRFKDRSSKNCTELISRNADSYGMAILAEGLPGTPQENEGKRAFILLDEFIIGRDNDNSDLFLDSKTVGRQHARISRHEGSYFITDLGSKNGTRLDGRRLNRNEEYLLPDRCRLQFADHVFFFQNEEPL